QADVVPSGQLIVSHTGTGGRENAIKLTGLDYEHVAGGGGMAAQAIERAGIEPLLSATAAGGADSDIFSQSVGDDVGISIIGAPFIGDAIDCAIGIAHEEPSFEPSQDVGIGIVHGQIEVFHKNSPVRESPFAGGSEMDKSIGRQRQPAM